MSERKKVRAFTVTYTVGNGLYINMTNRCTNACTFCIRNNDDGAYGSDSLWLSHEPSVEEILSSVFERDLLQFSEIVFCGYGEPSLRLNEARLVALSIKEKYPKMKIRMNTNGQSDLIFGENTAPLFAGAFDSVSISLNAPDAEKYQEICRSIYGTDALDAVIAFASHVKEFVPEVAFSVVREFITDDEIERCKQISLATGVPLRIRDYIS